MLAMIDCPEANRAFVRDGMPYGWQVVRFATEVEGSCVVREISQEMCDAGYSERSLFSMTTALVEAIVNAIKHGHGHDYNKTVETRYCVDASRVLVEVEDEGNGFDPDSVPDPTAPENLERTSGRGIMMMQQLLSWIKFNERGNCVTLCEFIDNNTDISANS